MEGDGFLQCDGESSPTHDHAHTIPDGNAFSHAHPNRNSYQHIHPLAYSNANHHADAYQNPDTTPKRNPISNCQPLKGLPGGWISQSDGNPSSNNGIIPQQRQVSPQTISTR